MIPVAANDVAFSIHAVLLTAITLFQNAIYERGSQKVSKVSIGIVSVAWLVAAVCFFIALPNNSWLWLLSVFKYAVVPASLAVMNFLRKSTDGFSIGNILLDFSGGIANYGQMVVQSTDQDSWVNFYGNIAKVLLSLEWEALLRNILLLSYVSVFFDIIFIIQHYVLYRGKKSSKLEITTEQEDQIREHLVRNSDQSSPENV
ncbi:Cystinosin-like [Glycine soja]|uniref:Cystinosin-like n=1 Tax=Glycine soja TaxID=3848 RepID=A0A445GF82_GLYSO|nr:Cystinosin-like [Glycine soja]